METPGFLTPHRVIVRKIKTVSLHLDEFNIPEDVVFKIDFNRTFSYDVVQSLFILNLNIIYSVPNAENERRNVLDCIIHNVFEIENIKGFIDAKNVIKLPLELLSTLVGLSITHSRAVISVLTAGSALGETLLPIVNPMELTKAFFDEVSAS